MGQSIVWKRVLKNDIFCSEMGSGLQIDQLKEFRILAENALKFGLFRLLVAKLIPFMVNECLYFVDLNCGVLTIGIITLTLRVTLAPSWKVTLALWCFSFPSLLGLIKLERYDVFSLDIVLGIVMSISSVLFVIVRVSLLWVLRTQLRTGELIAVELLSQVNGLKPVTVSWK